MHTPWKGNTYVCVTTGINIVHVLQIYMVQCDSEIYAVLTYRTHTRTERYYRNIAVQRNINLCTTKTVTGQGLPYTPFQQVHAETGLQIPKQDKKPGEYHIIRTVSIRVNDVHGAVYMVSYNERNLGFSLRTCLFHLVFFECICYPLHVQERQ